MPISRIKGSAINDNIELSGTEAFKAPVGTTAQREGSPKPGDQRFNSTLSLMEYYDGNNWKAIDSPPVVSSISPTTESDANANIVITGSNFQSGATVKFVGNDGTEYNSPTVTFTNSTSVTATTPATPLSVSNEPYDIKLTNPSGLSGVLDDALDAGGVPTFNTAAGSLGTIPDALRSTSVNYDAGAVDPDGDTITYSLSDGALPSGLTLNTSTGAITGNADAVGSDTTSTFTIRATTASGDFSERIFTITVQRPVATGGTELVYTDGGTTYVSHTFTSNGNFVLNTTKSLDILMIGGGGHGGVWHAGGGGAGAMIEASGSTSSGTYSLVVGAGGTNNGDQTIGGNGQPSQGFGMDARGGGRGGLYASIEPERSANIGSGAGANGTTTSPYNTGSSAGTGTSTLGSYTGNIYRTSGGNSANSHDGGGGGGAAGGGDTGVGNVGGRGGGARTNNWRTGTNEFWAAGGGGGSWGNSTIGGIGGSGGANVASEIGGRGSFNNNSGAPISAVANATANGHALPSNTGSGGAGDGSQAPNTSWETDGLLHGSNGIIVVRYAVT